MNSSEDIESKSKKTGLFSRPWIVLTASFFLTSAFGILYSYSDFFLPLSSQFNWSHTLNSTVPALALLVFSIGAIIGGYFTERVGFRNMAYIGTILVGLGTTLASQIQNLSELLVLFGLITPLGIAFVVIVATASPVRWFVKRRGMAVGIMAAGSGFGTLVVPPLIEDLIQIDHWRVGFLVLGLGFFALLCVASFFMQTPDDLSRKPYGWSKMNDEEKTLLIDSTPKQALSGRPFWMIYVMFFLGSFGATMFLVHAIPLAGTLGINELNASIALGVFGAGSLFSRVAIGMIADRLSRMTGVIVSFLVQVVSMALLPFSSSSLVLLFYLCSFGVGFGYGGYLSDFIALSGDIFGPKWIQRIWAFDETAYGIAGLIAPVLAGAFFDRLHSYSLIFEIATIAALGGLILSVIFARDLKKNKVNGKLVL